MKKKNHLEEETKKSQENSKKMEDGQNIEATNTDTAIENPNATLEELNIAVQEANEKYKEVNDKYLRLYSEFDNYKKRTTKERLELLKHAGEDIISAMLPVVDDFERALNAMEKKQNMELDIEGITLIANKFKNILIQKGLKEMESPIGKELNTDYHDAITNIPAPSEDMKGKIIDVIEKGYILNEKVIRFAKVVVGQ